MVSLDYKILFTSDCNGHEGHNPYAYLVVVNKPVTIEQLKEIAYRQLGATRSGGHVSWMVENLRKQGYVLEETNNGRLSDFTEKEYDLHFPLISGNY